MSASSEGSLPVFATGLGGVLGAGLAAAGVGQDGCWGVGPLAAAPLVVVGQSPPAAFAACRFVPADLAAPGATAALLAAWRPRVLLHAAALARIDDCEADPERAARLQLGVLAEAAEAGVRAVLCSTDQVFSGAALLETEDAPPAPLHAYGRSKVGGEQACLAGGGAVARLPLLLGPPVPGRPERCGADAALVRAARDGRVLSLFTDEWRAPADPALLASALGRLLAEDLTGIFHLGGADVVSRDQLAERLFAACGRANPHRPASLADWRGPPRPPRLVLDCTRARRELGFSPPDLRQSLARTVAWAHGDQQQNSF